MKSLAEMKDKEYIPSRAFISCLVRGSLSLNKINMMNLGELRRLRIVPDTAERYSIPPREYVIPEYHAGMRSSCSNEKYLRATLFCEPNDPVVVALATELGAYQISDREFTERAFLFVKDKLLLNEGPMNDVAETFQRGTGNCFHLTSAFIALCRCAGIKARYKVFAPKMVPSWYNAVIEPDPFIKRWYDSLGYLALEGEAEVFLDGNWVVANVTAQVEWQAATGTPINRLGEDSLGNWYSAAPGTEMIMESLPYGLGLSLYILHRFAPGSMERVNIKIKKQKELGKRIIKEAGGIEAYDMAARARQGPLSPKMALEPKERIIFED